MNAVLETNQAFSDPFHSCAPDLGARLMPIPAQCCSHKIFSAPERRQEPRDIDATEAGVAAERVKGASGDRLKAWGETVGFSLAVLAVIGLGALGGWAVMLVFNSLMQAQSLVVQNSFVFHR